MDKLAFSVLNKLLTLSPFELHGLGVSPYALSGKYVRRNLSLANL